MEKYIKTSVLAVCVLCISSAAFAGYTYHNETVGQTLNKDNYGDPFVSQVSSPSAITQGVLSWTHNLVLPTSDTPLEVVSASLAITAYNGMNAHGVWVDDTTKIGVLGGATGTWSPTVFNLLSPVDVSATLLDGQMKVSVVANSEVVTNLQVLAVASSTLTVEYKVGEYFEDPEPTIPAPGALVLGSLGAGLVGWLRRRIA